VTTPSVPGVFPLILRKPRTRHDGLDCIVVGHNDVDFRMVQDFMEQTRQRSAACKDLEANSVRMRGERVTYMTLLNRTMAAATGRDPGLNVCELPHLGSCTLTSYLRKRSFNVEHINFYNSGKQRLASLLTSRPTPVAITTTLYVSDEPIAEVVGYVRRHNPDAPIIVGGPRINNVCAEYDEPTQDFLLEGMGADVYIKHPEGEETLARVVERLRDGGRTLTDIPNLILPQRGGGFIRTGSEGEHNDLNADAVDWNSFDTSLYVPTVQIRTARSCAFHCAFCRYPIMAGQLHLASIETVERDLRMLHEAGVKNLVFIDDTFNVPLPRFKNLLRMMIKNQFDFNWFSFFRCANSDPECFSLMRDSGCTGVFLGIESGDNQMLGYMNKAADINRYREGIRALKANGILTFAALIVGFPGETRQSALNTMAFLEDACPDFYRTEIYYHYGNVPIAQQAERFGITGAGYSWTHKSMDWQEAADLLQEMYSTVKGPRVLPGYMFDFWSIPYLTGKGVSIAQLKRFTEKAQPWLVDGFSGGPADPTPYERELADVFATATPTPAMHAAAAN
jgi:radical SAM PhpK family P-methyltransferase